MRRSLLLLLLLAGITLGAPLGPSVSAAYAEDPTPAPPKKLFTMDDERITESSGLARSHRHDGIWWTVNDSGDKARIFGVDRTGKVQAVLTYGAEPRDIEAIGVGPDDTIYVADIGDNRSRRDDITVYAIKEPEQLESQKVRYRAYDFSYPDGAHDAEALLVHPENGRLYFVTKDSRGGLYAAPKEPSREETNELKWLGEMPAAVTDATFLPDARRIMVRGYFTLTAMHWPGPKKYATSRLPAQPIGESIAVGPTDNTLLVGTEGKNSAVHQISVPPRKSGPQPTATVKPEASDSSGRGGTGDHTRRNIMIGAGVFALLAAFLTFPAGRRERLDAVLERQRVNVRAERHRRDQGRASDGFDQAPPLDQTYRHQAERYPDGPEDPWHEQQTQQWQQPQWQQDGPAEDPWPPRAEPEYPARQQEPASDWFGGQDAARPPREPDPGWHDPRGQGYPTAHGDWDRQGRRSTT